MEAPYILHACLVRLSDFLSLRHNKLCHFISDMMDYFWIPGNKETWVAALKAQSLDNGGSGEPSTEECSPL